MKSTNIMTLFSEEPRPGTGPSSILISAVVHGVAFIFLFLGLKHTPRMSEHPPDRYSVRLLHSPLVETRVRRASPSNPARERGETVARDMSAGGAPPAESIPYPAAQLPQRSQVLVQPDAPPEPMLQQEVSVPLAVMWSPENSPSKVLVAPPHQEPTTAQTRPAIIKPNREPNLSDLNITMTPFPSQTPIIPPGTTSPIVVRGREEIKQIPSTSSAQLEPPTPARVLSISPVQTAGPAAIPFTNQAASSTSPALVISTNPGKSSANGSGNPASKQSGVGIGDGAAASKGTGDVGTGSKGTGSGGTGTGGAGTGGTAVADGAPTGADTGANSGAGLGSEGRQVVHISLPKDGQFGVVVVGVSLADQYPEVVGIWSGRLMYTVYLHVGNGKSWILQYSVPRAQEAAAGGTITKPEAPWPYDILRPHLAPEDYTSDAVMVHGFVNLAGRFENLAMAFPTEFKQAKFLLDALQHWQFRPAKQNGQAAVVEILLIIPEETE